MADSPAEIHKAVRKILLIGALLIFCTVVTVWLSYVDFGSDHSNMFIGMALASVKAALVALIFMHLNHEARLVYKILAFTFAFCIALFVLFYFSNADPLVYAKFVK
jgi:caa(3)-type oxidase subunit IV